MLHELHRLRLAYFGFSEIMASPIHWFAEADNLREAAAVMWDAYSAEWALVETSINTPRGSAPASSTLQRLGLFKVAHMLLGLAMENLLKGLLLARNKSIIVEGSPKWPGNGHQQRQMATAAKLTLDDADGKVLDVL